ncbi:hypothetical protein [Paraburkholderia caribensis]|uniref:hypothetical protein n=1 Tax=Paraburkholderia caribensis TaxID=75105 RepID=UPI0034D2C92F
MQNARKPSVAKVPKRDSSNTTQRPEFPFQIGAGFWKIERSLRRVGDWELPGSLDFSVDFSNGKNLLDAEYSRLLTVTQQYFESVWYSRVPKVIVQEWTRIRFFIKFVVEDRGVSNFSDVWGVDDYVAWVKSAPRRVTGGKSAVKGAKTGKYALYGYLQPVKNLWSFSRQFPDGLQEEPWAGRTSGKVAGLTHKDINQAKPYAIDEFAGFVRIAISDIGGVDELCSELGNLHLVYDKRSHMKRISRIRTAVAVVMLAYVGLRPAELVSLKLHCIVYGTLQSSEGPRSVPWLEGRIFKDKPQGGVPHRWLAAEEVVLAVSAMQKLRLVLERCIENNAFYGNTQRALIASRDYLIPRMDLAEVGQTLTPSAVNELLARFASRPEVQAVLHASSQFNQRRFRPTTARACAALKIGDIRYFMAHYGHSNYNVTAGYFATFADDEFRENVEKSANAQMQNVVTGILSSKAALAGRRGAKMEPLRRQYAVLTFKNRKELVEHFVKTHHIKIGPHSFCITSKDAKLCPPGCIYDETKCLGCDNGVVTEEHIGVWSDIEERTRALIAEFPDGSPARLACENTLSAVETTLIKLKHEVNK